MSEAPFIKLKANAKGRVLAGHPWIFANEVEELLAADYDGQVVEARDRRGRMLGSGIYNSRSQIIWRRLAAGSISLDGGYLRTRLSDAVERRATAGNASFRRLVWSESDGLPGVVVDQFGDTLVMQVQTLAMETHRDEIARILLDLTGAVEVIHRDDASIRRLEGLDRGVSTRSGTEWEPRWMTIDGFDYWLDLMSGQKTGFYLDQREQHAHLGKQVAAMVAAGRRPRVLDAFCNQGAFALHAARAGAAEVLGLDSAADAIAQARLNAERNGLTHTTFEEANVFDWFTANRTATWDVVVLDPPPFAKSRKALAGALRGYKELNLRALQCLAPGGILATYTCSHHMQDAELRQVLAGAAADARRQVRVVEFCHQPADHPVMLTMPESEYLRGYIVRVD
ncbi:class I SAM-dependent rRNA methyltransferase [Synoicihabitans lomoniglobus]|uniref:Class I SAM-dependent rRNA methyltransferase n=1 Tax=Synoicihabitans lomoniglobus TaxID=2909285 RepID=A0AAF0CQQ2_9BACT|nr:class I SAM-dependent rRNA methyltransferase [Opitutaceae bacterium LMO-M01]WED66278.1 class I SAM-dependent rRNA methyltransferase [Opitutaceae bacterium LMO-M01]